MKKEKIAEIRNKYKNEWLLIINYKLDKSNRIKEGVVVAHSRNRDEIYNRAMRIKDNMAIEYMGEVPANLVVILKCSE